MNLKLLLNLLFLSFFSFTAFAESNPAEALPPLSYFEGKAIASGELTAQIEIREQPKETIQLQFKLYESVGKNIPDFVVISEVPHIFPESIIPVRHFPVDGNKISTNADKIIETLPGSRQTHFRLRYEQIEQSVEVKSFEAALNTAEVRGNSTEAIFSLSENKDAPTEKWFIPRKEGKFVLGGVYNTKVPLNGDLRFKAMVDVDYMFKFFSGAEQNIPDYFTFKKLSRSDSAKTAAAPGQSLVLVNVTENHIGDSKKVYAIEEISSARTELFRGTMNLEGNNLKLEAMQFVGKGRPSVFFNEAQVSAAVDSNSHSQSSDRFEMLNPAEVENRMRQEGAHVTQHKLAAEALDKSLVRFEAMNLDSRTFVFNPKRSVPLGKLSTDDKFNLFIKGNYENFIEKLERSLGLKISSASVSNSVLRMNGSLQVETKTPLGPFAKHFTSEAQQIESLTDQTKLKQLERFISHAHDLGLISKSKVGIVGDKVKFTIDMAYANQAVKIIPDSGPDWLKAVEDARSQPIEITDPERVTQEYEKMLEQRRASAQSSSPNENISEAPRLIEMPEKQIPTYNPGEYRDSEGRTTQERAKEAPKESGRRAKGR